MKRLWRRMTELYGHKWTSSFGLVGEGAFETWTKGLAPLSANDIRQGMDRCLNREEEWPPTLPAFRHLCKEARPEEENAAMYRTPTCLALPKPRPSKDKARPFLQALRAALGKGQRGSTDGEPAA